MRQRQGRRHESGMALIVVVMILSLVSAVAIASLTESGMEAASAGRTRSAARALYVADAGIEIARNHISQNPPDTNPINVDMGGGWTVQSRSKSDGAPVPILRAGDTVGGTEGYSINVGSGFASAIYIVNVTSTTPGGASAEVEAKIARISGASGGY